MNSIPSDRVRRSYDTFNGTVVRVVDNFLDRFALVDSDNDQEGATRPTSGRSDLLPGGFMANQPHASRQAVTWWLPRVLLNQVKARAQERGETVLALVTRALERELQAANPTQLDQASDLLS